MTPSCVNCRFFSGLIDRIDPDLFSLECQAVRGRNQLKELTNPLCVIDIDTPDISKCKNKGGICQRYPALEKQRPIIWDGKDWCGEWAELSGE